LPTVDLPTPGRPTRLIDPITQFGSVQLAAYPYGLTA
jgi:hypothetical protein